MTEPGGVTSTLEDYLEAISALLEERGAARVRDIAERLSVHKSTVTAALRSLAEKRLVNYAPYEMTTLTRRGRRVADAVGRRHRVIQRFLTDVLGIDDETASQNACRMEHGVDRDVLRRLATFADFVGCKDGGRDCARRFRSYLEQSGASAGGAS
jgi:DtxR family Mn-dependent transcriptional regulator